MSREPGKILFLLRNLYYLRNFEAPIRGLAEHGHKLTILADPAKKLPEEIRGLVADLERTYGDAIGYGDAHGRLDFRRRLADEIHTARDILRYYTPHFVDAAKLRRRAESKATPLARFLYARPKYWDRDRNRVADERLARWDTALPPDADILKRLRTIAPDLLIVSPLVDLRTDQIDWVHAARSLGIPTMLAVASWDNLTSKSRIQVPVERTLVWNDIQKDEATRLHAVDPERVVVTGAQLYDNWFGRKSSRDRAAFLAAHGLAPSERLILYVGSSLSIAKDEPEFVTRWVTAVRGSADPKLAQANILVRPHPMHFAGYETIGDRQKNVVVYPKRGGLPVTQTARESYFDALYHADVIVGLNTSAIVEATILGKTCLTLRDAGHDNGQQGTLHYHYLTDAGILREAPTLDRHLEDLSAVLASPDAFNAPAKAFVETFIRPAGRDRPASPIFVAAVESAIGLDTLWARPPPASRWTRIWLDAAAILTLGLFGLWHRMRRALRRH